MRILLVEDHAVLAQSLLLGLRAEGHTAEAVDDPTPERALDRARAFGPDLVLLDLDLGTEHSGLDLIGPLRELGARVLVVTGTHNRASLGASLESGAEAVFRKEDPFDRLLEAIAAVGRGEEAMPVTRREELLREMRDLRAARREVEEVFARLTEREAAVLAGLVAGHSADAIAADHHVSLATVRTQIRGILTKLDVSSQLAAVAMAREAGWPWD